MASSLSSCSGRWTWRPGLTEIGALVLTPIVWPIGVIRLWTSFAWTTREKLIGTLLPPGGYAGVYFALPWLTFGFHALGGCSNATDGAGRVYGQSCWGIASQPVVIQALVFVGLRAAGVLLLVLPVLVGIYLGTKLRRRVGLSRGLSKAFTREPAPTRTFEPQEGAPGRWLGAGWCQQSVALLTPRGETSPLLQQAWAATGERQ